MFYPLLKPFIESSHRKTVKRGEIIYHEGDTPESLYLIEDGLVGLFHISENGKETFLRVFGKDDMFGHRSYFAETDYHATTIALSKTTLVIISKKQCQEICQHHPELMATMVKMLATNLGHAELRLAGLQDKTASSRIIESLLFLKLKYPEHIWTRKEIAEFSGTTFETVVRVMTKLDEEKLIEKEGRNFNILDTDKLLLKSKEEV
jgi:CRP-like cAMP-binding protein